MNPRVRLRVLIPIACALALGAFWIWNGRPESPGPRCAVRGMALALDNSVPEARIVRDLDELRAVGANAVLIQVSEIQEDWRASFLAPEPERTTSVRKLAFALREAKERGFRTALMPLVLLRRTLKRTEWRGMIVPGNAERWFLSYRGMILKYADLAQELSVDFFSVGSELVSMEGHTGFWRGLIRDVRGVYRGRLLYSSNWDYLGSNPAWRELDVLGLNAYHELARGRETPGEAEIAERWRRILSGVQTWAEGFGKPLLITEVGYPSREEGLSDPWDHFRTGKADPNIQLTGYRAFLSAWRDLPNLEGVFFYEWGGDGGTGDGGYTPRGKPALTVLEKWMRGDETAILRPIIGWPGKKR